MSDEKDFDVILTSELPEDSNTTVITTSEIGKQWLETAMKNYNPLNTQYEAYLNELGMIMPIVTNEKLNSLAMNAQSELKKILEINTISRLYVNRNWIIGKVVETITSNINSEFRLSYKDFSNDKKKMDELEVCKQIITDFNDEINLRRLIKNSVPTVYIEGNYIVYCRENKGHYIISWLPLGVVEISDYNINGEPVILVNMDKLIKSLSKTIKKNKKNKPLFFAKLGEEIKANYPPEVYQAFINKDEYAKLNNKNTGCMRINNQNRKYGLTPIFRALFPILMLEQFDETDRINARAKAKKFIVQLMRKEIMGKDYDKETYEEQAYAHSNLMQAFKQKTVLVTPPPYVEDIKYVEPSTSNTDTNTVTNYINRALSTLGIQFLMNAASTGASVASISLDQLMKTINSITEQLEFMLEKWYREILSKNGHSSEFAPTIRVLDSELLEMKVKQDLAKLLYCNFNLSMDTSLSVLGIDINDEKAKRKKENDEKLENIFTPRSTAYTSSGKGTIMPDEVGRPAEDNVDTVGKQEYDKQYNENNRLN